MSVPECTIAFDNSCNWMWTLSSIFTGFKLLDEQKLLKVKSVSMDRNFRADGRYPDRMVVEVKMGGKTLVYDMADGYQSINSAEVFDSQLDRVDYYFKSSYDPDFASRLRNREKFQKFGMSYECSCKGNYFEKANLKDALAKKQFVDAAKQLYLLKRRQKVLDYRVFEGSTHFDEYGVLFWSRLWEYDVDVKTMMGFYKELTQTQAQEKVEKEAEMIRQTNRRRIENVRALKEQFGEKFVGGLCDCEASRKMAPDLITHDPRIETREAYMASLKKGYINILSAGLHGCIGARYGETVAAGRVLLTDPLVYTPPGLFADGQNYLTYTD
ncbi:MAG TPA: hypothetical protein DDY98_01015, partial [Ruminococcaceae bacterium]|nr:hypothetical protein [Oscillospiraceae bacterium]